LLPDAQHFAAEPKGWYFTLFDHVADMPLGAIPPLGKG
jgi:hypothetical protein